MVLVAGHKKGFFFGFPNVCSNSLYTRQLLTRKRVYLSQAEMKFCTVVTSSRFSLSTAYLGNVCVRVTEYVAIVAW